MIWYWIGVFIALCVNTVVLFMIAKETKQVALGTVFAVIVRSLFSWVELGFIILFVVIYLIGELSNIVIWKSNRGE